MLLLLCAIFNLFAMPWIATSMLYLEVNRVHYNCRFAEVAGIRKALAWRVLELRI
jgi:hypothetical protein